MNLLSGEVGRKVKYDLVHCSSSSISSFLLTKPINITSVTSVFCLAREREISHSHGRGFRTVELALDFRGFHGGIA